MTESPRVSPTRIAEEAGKLLGASLSDIVPPEAQLHLINAQRELLLAVAVTIEHNAARGSRRASKNGERPAKRARRAPSRVELD